MALESIGETSANGTTVTAGGSADTYGSYVELSASTGQDCERILVQCQSVTLQKDGSCVIAIATGAASSEVDQFEFMFPPGGVIGQDLQSFEIPWPIPSGTRVSARVKSSVASVAVAVKAIISDDDSWGTGDAAELVGISGSKGTVIDPGDLVKGSWVELTSSTSHDYDHIVIFVGHNNNTADTSQSILIDIGTGAAASETVVVPDVLAVNSSQESSILGVGLYVPIPSGTRVAARAATDISAIDRLFDISILGVNLTAPSGGGSGETDGDKVLANSAIITGNVALANVLDTETHGTLDSANVLEAGGGNYHPATAAEVQDGVTFGDNETETGTYDQSGDYSDPGVTNVLDGVGYKYGSASNNRTGTRADAPVASVLDSQSYGAGGTGLTGTYHATLPAEVLDSASFGPASGTTGTYHEATTGEVQLGVAFGAASALTGTYSPTCDYPAVGDVRDGVAFNSGGLTGTLNIPFDYDVRSGVGYGAGATETTGGLVVPAVGDVRDGTTFDYIGSSTGTLDLPSTQDVQNAVTFDNATKSGTFVAPAESNVLDGINYGHASEYTGTHTETPTNYPAESDVRFGVSFASSSTGSAYIPTASNVLLGVNVDATTGTVTLPDASDVRAAVTFGASLGSTGTAVIPAPADVEEGVAVDATVGTFAVPDEWTVLSGTTYGSGSEFAGNYSVSFPPVSKILDSSGYTIITDTGGGPIGAYTAGTYHATTALETKTGVAFGAASILTGSYTGSDRWSDPGEENVRLGTTYKANSLADNQTGTVRLPEVEEVEDGVVFGASDALTGTLIGGTSDYPDVSDVRLGTSYDDGALTGTLDLPDVSDVRLGTVFDNTTKTGTLVPKPDAVGAAINNRGIGALAKMIRLDLTQYTVQGDLTVYDALMDNLDSSRKRDEAAARFGNEVHVTLVSTINSVPTGAPHIWKQSAVVINGKVYMVVGHDSDTISSTLALVDPHA